MNKTGNSKFQIRLPILLTIAVAAGILIGATMAGGSAAQKNLVDSYLKFKEVLNYIERDYVDEVNTEDLVETAIKKMLDKLDPHSVYIPAEDKEVANAQLEGEFEGIGIEFNIIKDTIFVIAPISGGPSEQVGLKSGDKIVEVEGETVAGTGIDYSDVFDLLRGPKDSKVTVGVKRNGVNELLDFTITRDKIPHHSIEVSYMVEEEVGYIKIGRFSKNTYEEFKTAMNDLLDKGMNKMILDLTNNPGGYMDRAVSIADEFISGNKMIVYTDGKQDRYDSELRAYRDGLYEENPLIVLINESSASASEIVAGAIQDNDRGLIVGRRSFGKGLVQMPIDLNDNSELRLTISRYFTPSGRSIQKPYDDDPQDYKMDIYNRLKHGEMFNADSISFNDSLKYETRKGRTVYGGGGITPDYFVPIDTAKNSRYLDKLIKTNVLREYTISYYKEHKDMLESFDRKEYLEDFQISQKMVNELIQAGENSGIPFDQSDYNKSKDLIKNQIKAYVANQVWNNKGYYPVVNKHNEIFQQALQLFDEARRLASHNE